MTSRSLHRRLARLEAKSGISAEPERTIFLCVGDDHSANHAISGQGEWNRGPDEDHEQFQARIAADLRAAHDTPAVMLFNLEP